MAALDKIILYVGTKSSPECISYTYDAFILQSGKIEKSFEFKWQMLLFTTVQGIVITWMNTAWLIKVMQLAGSLQTKPK